MTSLEAFMTSARAELDEPIRSTMARTELGEEDITEMVVSSKV